jgi:LysR family nod box-dependent transcriptional activator
VNLASIDLNLLVALDAILSERHLTRAGERLGVTQPTMSHTLARLRRLFDDDLLLRVGRDYELTPLAQDLREPLRDILKNIERTIERRPAFNPSTDERTFTIAASDYATYLVFQPALRRLQDEAPGVRLKLFPLHEIGRAVETGDIDLAIWPSSIGPELPHEVLFTDRWVAVAWSGNEEVDETISLEQCLALPHVAYGAGLDARLGILEKTLTASHPEARIAMSVESFFLLPFMLTSTRYIALVHERLARRLAGMGEIKILQLAFDTEPVTEAIYWHPRLTPDPAHRWFREMLVQCTADMSLGV